MLFFIPKNNFYYIYMKLKTLSSAKKRVRGTGKIMVDKTAKRHLLSQKSRKAKGRDKYGKVLSDANMTAAKISLPYGA